MEHLPFTHEMAVVLALLGLTVFLFVSELLRVDVAALAVLVLLGLVSTLPDLGALADPRHLFDGFASNAVISIIAITIIGAALDRAGLMGRVAAWILKYGGTTEVRLVPILTGAVSVVSSFMQNVGAAALFLPVAGRVSSRTGVPLSRLLMPIGFGAILGGTVTMIGTSPLIILNDLIAAANAELPEAARMQPFGLFSVTPVGLSLVLAGILYFTLFGPWVLPSRTTAEDGSDARSMAEYLRGTYGLDSEVAEVTVPGDSPLDGQRIGAVMDLHHVYVVGGSCAGERTIAPDVATEIKAPCRLALLGRDSDIDAFCHAFGLARLSRLEHFAEDFAQLRSGVAEIVVPPGSPVIGKSPRELRFRNTFSMSPLAIHRGGETLSRILTKDHAATAISNEPLRAGDTLAVHTPWDSLARLKRSRDFVVVTTGFPEEETRPHKAGWALFFFALALGLVLLSDLRLSLCLMTGAVGMVLTRVLSMDEAYRAVSWKTVFLLASLIPLGQAVQNTGTAAWIAQAVVAALDGWPVWTLQLGIALLATGFSLVMSNVGATVLLVPLAVSIAVAADADPAVFALTVGVATSNSFVIPTHQVNALVMGPAGYRVRDYLKAGGIMTVLFLVVSTVALNAFY